MKKSIQTLVFALLLGAAFVSCKKKDDVIVTCYEDALSPITYKSSVDDSDIKVQKNTCTDLTLFYTTKNANGVPSTQGLKVTLTSGANGSYAGTTTGDLSTPAGAISIAATPTTLSVGGALVFTGRK